MPRKRDKYDDLGGALANRVANVQAEKGVGDDAAVADALATTLREHFGGDSKQNLAYLDVALRDLRCVHHGHKRVGESCSSFRRANYLIGICKICQAQGALLQLKKLLEV